MTCEEMCRDSLDAAKRLKSEHQWRSCVSRAYFATYAAATALLIQKGFTRFSRGWGNPAHGDLPGLIRGIQTIPPASRTDPRSFLSILVKYRIAADYRPGWSIYSKEALDAVRLAEKIIEIAEGRR